jgi:hypothetical protein
VIKNVNKEKIKDGLEFEDFINMFLKGIVKDVIIGIKTKVDNYSRKPWKT